MVLTPNLNTLVNLLPLKTQALLYTSVNALTGPVPCTKQQCVETRSCVEGELLRVLMSIQFCKTPLTHTPCLAGIQQGIHLI